MNQALFAFLIHNTRFLIPAYPMITFLHNFVPQPLALSIGFLNIHWYGLFAVAGILAGLAVVWRIGKTRGITADEIFDLAFYIIIFGILGARIYSVFLDWPYYLQNPMQIVAVWNGGLAIHGAIIGGALALLVYARKNQQSFWRWADLIAVSLPLGQAIGRFGNYFNQELFGAPTNLPWGIPIEPALRPSQFSAEQYFHPTFLYEAILNIVNFLVLLWVFRKWASGQVGKWRGCPGVPHKLFSD